MRRCQSYSLCTVRQKGYVFRTWQATQRRTVRAVECAQRRRRDPGGGGVDHGHAVDARVLRAVDTCALLHASREAARFRRELAARACHVAVADHHRPGRARQLALLAIRHGKLRRAALTKHRARCRRDVRRRDARGCMSRRVSASQAQATAHGSQHACYVQTYWTHNTWRGGPPRRPSPGSRRWPRGEYRSLSCPCT
jgi:hypothetical protein